MSKDVVEAKTEYTKQLSKIMKPHMYKVILKLYNESVYESENEQDILVNFQLKLKQIPKWNSDQIEEKCNGIIQSCNYFSELLTAVFVSNVKILTSIKKDKKKVKVIIPPNQKFISRAYNNCARNIYNDPYLFSNTRYNKNISSNLTDVYRVIENCIEDTIRELLPLEHILQLYTQKEFENDEETPEDDEETPEDNEETPEDNETPENNEETPENNEEMNEYKEEPHEDDEDDDDEEHPEDKEPNKDNQSDDSDSDDSIDDSKNESPTKKSSVNEFFNDTPPVKDIHIKEYKKKDIEKSKKQQTLFDDSDIED